MIKKSLLTTCFDKNLYENLQKPIYAYGLFVNTASKYFCVVISVLFMNFIAEMRKISRCYVNMAPMLMINEFFGSVSANFLKVAIVLNYIMS